MRHGDKRFATQARHQHDPHPLHNKTATYTSPNVFTTTDSTYDVETRTCVYPAGKSLDRYGGNRKTITTSGYEFAARSVTVGRVRYARSVYARPTPCRCATSRAFTDASTPTGPRTPRACKLASNRASTRRRDAGRRGDASFLRSRCLAICAPKSGSIALRCAAAPR